MTLAEILKAHGMTDEQITAISADMKSNKVFTASEENLDVRYNKLKAETDAKVGELEKANALITQLQGANGNEDLKVQLATYQTEKEQLQAQLEQTRLNSAIKVALLSEKAVDVDYLTFKLKEKGELAIDEKGEIKGWNDTVKGLKIQFPNQFEASSTKKIDEQKLPDGDNKQTVTKEAFNKMGYADRVKLHGEQPEVYAELAKQ